MRDQHRQDLVQRHGVRVLERHSGNTPAGIGVRSLDDILGVFIVDISIGFFLCFVEQLGQRAQNAAKTRREVLRRVEDDDSDSESSIALDVQPRIFAQQRDKLGQHLLGKLVVDSQAHGNLSKRTGGHASLVLGLRHQRLVNGVLERAEDPVEVVTERRSQGHKGVETRVKQQYLGLGRVDFLAFFLLVLFQLARMLALEELHDLHAQLFQRRRVAVVHDGYGPDLLEDLVDVGQNPVHHRDVVLLVQQRDRLLPHESDDVKNLFRHIRVLDSPDGVLGKIHVAGVQNHHDLPQCVECHGPDAQRVVDLVKEHRHHLLDVLGELVLGGRSQLCQGNCSDLLLHGDSGVDAVLVVQVLEVKLPVLVVLVLLEVDRQLVLLQALDDRRNQLRKERSEVVPVDLGHVADKSEPGLPQSGVVGVDTRVRQVDQRLGKLRKRLCANGTGHGRDVLKRRRLQLNVVLGQALGGLAHLDHRLQKLQRVVKVRNERLAGSKGGRPDGRHHCGLQRRRVRVLQHLEQLVHQRLQVLPDRVVVHVFDDPVQRVGTVLVDHDVGGTVNDGDDQRQQRLMAATFTIGTWSFKPVINTGTNFGKNVVTKSGAPAAITPTDNNPARRSNLSDDSIKPCNWLKIGVITCDGGNELANSANKRNANAVGVLSSFNESSSSLFNSSSSSTSPDAILSPAKVNWGPSFWLMILDFRNGMIRIKNWSDIRVYSSSKSLVNAISVNTLMSNNKLSPTNLMSKNANSLKALKANLAFGKSSASIVAFKTLIIGLIKPRNCCANPSSTSPCSSKYVATISKPKNEWTRTSSDSVSFKVPPKSAKKSPTCEIIVSL